MAVGGDVADEGTLWRENLPGHSIETNDPVGRSGWSHLDDLSHDREQRKLMWVNSLRMSQV